MKSKSLKLPLSIIAAIALAHNGLLGLSVDVERMSVDDGLPWGYADLTGVRNGSETYTAEAFEINVSAAPFVDYMVAMNSAAPGIIAEKVDGPFLDAQNTTAAQMDGGGSLSGANGGFSTESEPIRVGSERFTLFLQWDDGTPFPATTGWFGVSWGGFNDTYVQEMEVRVDLAVDGPVNVVHWFNDGWLYSTDVDGTEGNAHKVLDGHEFNVTHHAADGSVIAEVLNVLPSGGAGFALGKTGDFLIFQRDHRQFYTASVSATRTAEGEYLMLSHRAGNMGYRATAVTLGNDRPWASEVEFALIPGEWINDSVWGHIYGFNNQWGYSPALGYIFADFMPAALYADPLGWLIAPHGSIASGLFLYRTASDSWIYLQQDLPGFYFDFASASWISI